MPSLPSLPSVKRLLLLLLTLCLQLTAGAQTLLIPGYAPRVIEQAVATRGSAPIAIIANANSGSGAKRDPAYTRAIAAARTAGVPVYYYLDLWAWPGDGILGVKKARLQTNAELAADAARWVKFYGPPEGWFLDDFSLKANATLTPAIRQLRGCIIGNPGTTCPPVPGIDVLILHEAKGWLQAPAIPPERAQIAGVFALKLPASDLPAAWAKASGCAFFYAHQLDDQWRNGQSAYNTLPAYWQQLTTLANPSTR